MSYKDFHFGDWLVAPHSCTLSRDGRRVQIEPRAMDVLLALCTQAGQIISAEELLQRCWSGMVVGENQVHKAITQLRRALADNARSAVYIENIRKRGYRTVAQVLLPVADATPVNRKSWAERSPYVGLDSFDTEHAAVFFGRDHAIRQLHEAMLAQAKTGRALMLVLGPSGSGKTSLIQAGLLPALSRQGGRFQVTSTAILDLGGIGDEALMTALGAALIDLEVDDQPLLRGHSAESLGQKLLQAPDAILGELRSISARQPQARAALLIDRLEALFTSSRVDDSLRDAFLVTLDRLARSESMIVLLACRNDFYAQIAREPMLMESKSLGGHYDLSPPTRAEIAQMIRLPAEAAGLRFGIDEQSHARLDDLLCEAAAHSPDALPLLQYTLHELYLQREHTGELSINAYRALGGLEGAIGRRAETVLAGLPAASQAALPRILSLLVTLSANGDTVSGHHALWSALQSEAEHALVHTLVEQRLFVSLVIDRQPAFGVAHEALLRQWPRVVEWIAVHRQALRVRSRVEVQARQWLSDGRHVQRLLPRGRQLEEARELLGQESIPLEAEVEGFIGASVSRVKRGERLRLAAIAIFAVVSLVAGGLGLFAHHAEEMARQHQQEADELMGYMLVELADKLPPLGREDLLADVGRKALSYLLRQHPEEISFDERTQQARALRLIADAALARHDTGTAQGALSQSQSLLERNLAKNPTSPGLLREFALNEDQLGQLRFQLGDLNGATKHLKQFLYTTEQLHHIAPANSDTDALLSGAHNSLGSIAFQQGDEETAIHEFAISSQLKRDVIARHPADIHFYRAEVGELADTLTWQASAQEATGHLQQALSLDEQAITELLTLQKDAPEELMWTYRLAIARYWHALLLKVLGHEEQAGTELSAAQTLATDLLHHDPNNGPWLHISMMIAMLSGDVHADLEPLPLALTEQRATAAKLDELIKSNAKHDSFKSLNALSQVYLANTLQRLKDPLKAQALLQAALEELPPAQQDSLTPEVASRRPFALIQLAQVQNMLGQTDASHASCQRAASLLEPLVLRRPHDYHLLSPWILANDCLGKGEAVESQKNWLARIGYADPQYLRDLLTFSQPPSTAKETK
ncbi:transcriptional regulator [Dyella flagellata]|uniref:Transcriptional regulator n=1 Tax=Dyella flagellata TaxID=1867833 RepID=A0ABQ5XCM2_9GAMM|nr:transcriptional regulator [Dyella flagellata]